MTVQAEVRIVDVPRDERNSLDRILDESFEGWYLKHSKRTLRRIESVRAAKLGDKSVALVMVKKLDSSSGYVYYIAVAEEHRKKGIAGILLDDSLERFKQSGMKEVFASVEEDNEPSEALFASRGFTRTSFGQVSKTHGHLNTMNLYREMMVVPGEVLLHKTLA